jgi:putative membrane protein
MSAPGSLALADDEVATVERAIARVEAATGVQIVAAIVPRSDAYPEIPWRAFALGASLTGLFALVVDLARPDWLTAQALLVQTLAILGGGALAALATTRIAPFARLFLGVRRASVEARQCAESLFLTRELFATPRRDAVLMMVSAFEHRVVIVPDVYCKGKVATAEWERVVARMTPLLRDAKVADAFVAGLESMEALLAGKGFAPSTDGAARNVLADALVRGSSQ